MSNSKMEMQPLVSVIIPCRNRGEYLRHTLHTCMMQDYERMEVIVSDDGSTDRTRDIVQDAIRKDGRIRFTAPPAGAAGMRNNFEYVLSCVKPGYVIALGGDDGLMPHGVYGMLQTLRETGMEMLAWPAPVYCYPGARGPRGQMTIHRQRGVRIVETRQFLARQTRHLNYLGDFESPMFYVKGVVSTRLVDKVRARSADGRFYQCPTPDGYSGIVLAGETERYAFSGTPFSIYGLSPASQGLAYLSNSADAKKESERFYQDVSVRGMHAELAGQPYSPLITLMTVDYLLTARDLPGWPGSFPEIDFRKVLGSAVRELTHGLYGKSRLCRELYILRAIAEHHGLGGFFRETVGSTRRRRERLPFAGTGVNAASLLLDAENYNLRNIIDAANAADLICRIYRDLTVQSLWDTLSRSVRYRLKALGKGDAFPPETDWKIETAIDGA